MEKTAREIIESDGCMKGDEVQEAAGVENRESGESKAQREDGAGSETDREPSADTESGYDEDGTGGGCGETGVGGGESSELGKIDADQADGGGKQR